MPSDEFECYLLQLDQNKKPRNIKAFSSI